MSISTQINNDIIKQLRTKIKNKEPIRLLVGGSPCTYWSICRRKDRETTSEGVGWELFYNYYLAKEKFKPDLFLYENNHSISKDIKGEISKYLKNDYHMLNAGLITGQQRKRCYWFNWTVDDLMEENKAVENYIDVYSNDKQNLELDDYYFKGGIGLSTTTPVLIGSIVNNGNYLNGKQPSQQYRVYSGKAKGICLNTGRNTSGIYMLKVGEKYIGENVYSVNDNKINVKGSEYDIALPNGKYVIQNISANDAERIQGLPIGYTRYIETNESIKEASNSQRFKAIGNGWSVDIVTYILSEMTKYIPRSHPIEILSMYDGISTARLIMDNLGFVNVIYKAYEIDENAIGMSKANYSDIRHCGDAFDLRSEQWEYSAL